MTPLSLLILAALLCGVYSSDERLVNMKWKVLNSNVKSGDYNTSIGVDLVEKLTNDAAECLTKDGKNLVATPRSFYNSKVDINATTTMSKASVYEFLTHSDGIFEGCPACSDTPYTQLANAFVYLTANSFWSGKIWISVMKSSNDGWTDDVQTNKNFFINIVGNCLEFSLYGLDCGVFSSIDDWEKIFGSTDWSYNESNLPLWYSHNDGDHSFSDFVQFGGYSKPYGKQFSTNDNICGVNVNFDYFPNR